MRVAWNYPFWIAHRGAGTLAPENTLAAMRLGAQYGCRMFECDVKISQDGIPFLLHDLDLNRTTCAIDTEDPHTHSIAGNLSWTILAQRDAGSWHSPAYAGEPIPTLERISHWAISNGYSLNIEIKPSPDTDYKTGNVIAKQVAKQWKNAETLPLLTSFKPESLLAAQHAAPHIPRGLLLEKLWSGWLQHAQQLDCIAIVCQHNLWNPKNIQQAQAEKMRCLAYTVNKAADIQHLIKLGIDGVITDTIYIPNSI